MVRRREQPPSRSRSREPPTAVTVTSGRQMRTMIRQRSKAKIGPDPTNRSARHHGERASDQDRQQLAVMNAAIISRGHDRPSAIRRFQGQRRKASERGSEQRLRARIRRKIPAQWNLNFAWRRSLRPGVGPSTMRPCQCSSCCWYCQVLPQRPFVRCAIRILIPMRSRSESAWSRCRCVTQRHIHARWGQARPWTESLAGHFRVKPARAGAGLLQLCHRTGTGQPGGGGTGPRDWARRPA